jgi:glycosyltransferase involved in cell wall biosynthesis
MPFLGIPFFFGPIGENVPIPLRILRHHGIKSIIRELVGRFIKHTSRNYNPIMRAIYNRAARIIVLNSSIYLKIRPKLRNKTFVIPAQGGFSINQNIKVLVDKDESNFTVLFVGRFVPIKNPDIAIESFLKFSKGHNNVKLIVIGGGPMEDKLRKIIEIESGSNKVMVLGWLERQRVQSYLEACDVLLFPTLEGGAGVVLETMSVGKPVICLDHGGPRDYITETCGIKVRVTTRKQIIKDLAIAIEKIYCSKELRINAGLAALQRFNEAYTWEKKIEQMNKLYQEAFMISNKDKLQ